MEEEFYFSGKKKIVLKKCKSHEAYMRKSKPGTIKKIENESSEPIESFKKGIEEDVYLEKKSIIKKVIRFTKNIFKNKDEIDFKLNVYQPGDNEKAVLTDKFILKFEEDATEDQINSLINDERYELEKREYGEKRFLGKIKNINTDYNKFLNIVNEINEKDFVKYAHPSFTRKIKMSKPPDDFRQEQWAINKEGVNINVKPVWDMNIKGQGIKIAIVDVGVDAFHPDLMINGQSVKGIDFYERRYTPSPENSDSHGTCCAGIAGAKENNNGITGIAPECEIIGIRVANDNGGDEGWETNVETMIVEGIQYAIQQGIHIISNSYELEVESEDLNDTLYIAKNLARNRDGCVLVWAAGNYKNNRNENHSLSYPAYLKDFVISVGAYNKNGQWVGEEEDWASKYGPELKICAPGIDILTTHNSDGNGNGKYGNFSGTSAAAPIVAGVAALILCAKPNLKSSQVEQILIDTADPITSNPPEKTGHGKVNAKKAVDEAINNY